MSPAGARLVGLLLLWIAVGFLADAALAPASDAALEQALGDEAPPGTPLEVRLANAVIGATLGLAGLVLLVRDPGEGLLGSVPVGRAGGGEPDQGPTRCYRCRARWPAGAEACPHCGAQRLR